MQQRIDYASIAPEAIAALQAIGQYVEHGELEMRLLALVRLRTAQICECAYWIDRHTKDALGAGEEPRRLEALGNWRESPAFSDRERLALAWTEAVTQSSGHVPEQLYDFALRTLTQKELVDLTLAVVTSNSWNRLTMALGHDPDVYHADQDIDQVDEASEESFPASDPPGYYPYHI